MIDLILFVFVVAVFYGGFKCGNQWTSLTAMWKAAKTWATE